MVLSDGWAGWSGEAPPGPPLKAMPPELFFFIRTYTLLRGMASGLERLNLVLQVARLAAALGLVVEGKQARSRRRKAVP